MKRKFEEILKKGLGEYIIQFEHDIGPSGYHPYGSTIKIECDGRSTPRKELDELIKAADELEDVYVDIVVSYNNKCHRLSEPRGCTSHSDFNIGCGF